MCMHASRDDIMIMMSRWVEQQQTHTVSNSHLGGEFYLVFRLDREKKTVEKYSSLFHILLGHC